MLCGWVSGNLLTYILHWAFLYDLWFIFGLIFHSHYLKKKKSKQKYIVFSDP